MAHWHHQSPIVSAPGPGPCRSLLPHTHPQPRDRSSLIAANLGTWGSLLRVSPWLPAGVVGSAVQWKTGQDKDSNQARGIEAAAGLA